MSLTTQSESVPEVDATRFATGWPLILTGSVKTSVANARTSVRPEASRWSSTSHLDQRAPLASTGRGMNGTGRAGSETYSSYAAASFAGAPNPRRTPACRYTGVGLTVQPESQPDGHAFRRRHRFVPV